VAVHKLVVTQEMRMTGSRWHFDFKFFII